MEGIWYDHAAGSWFTHSGQPWTVSRVNWQFRALAFWLGRESDGEWGSQKDDYATRDL